MTEKVIFWPKNEVRPQTYEDILKEYRAYVHDPKAELPAELLADLEKLGKLNQTHE